ncbi:MAG: NYN domain-containing protein [Actinomycetota bacterium]
MIDLPNDVAMTLVRAVGAYLRAMPPQELPAKLRRYQSFRPQGLARHRKELLGVLDDAALRARIAEWLEKDKPKIPRAEAELLRVAVDQSDGWEGELLSKAAMPKAKPRPASTEADRVAAEREKVRKARDEARKARQDARASVAGERAKTAELADEVRRSTRRIADLERTATAAARESERALDRVERDARKARSTLEKALGERDRAKEDAKSARREAMAARRDVTRLEQEVSALTKKQTTVRKKPAAPRERKQLPVPKGRLEDAKETLSEWLSTRLVHLVIDGYNVAKAEGGFGSLPLEEQRDQLVKAAAKLAHRVAGHTIIVFDGSKVAPGFARRSRSRVEVEYSRPDEIADDHIVARLEELPGDPVVLVTNDKELQRRARRLGATIATSNQLLALIR